MVSFTDSQWTTETEVFSGGKDYTPHNLEPDTQSLFLVRFCMAFSPTLPDELSKIDIKYVYMSTAYAAFLQLANVALQVGITYILLLDVEKEENSWESSYFQEHYSMSLSGAVDLLRKMPSPHDDPNVAHSIPKGIWEKCGQQTEHGLRHLSFYYFMIFVWVSKMFHEGLTSVVLFMRIIETKNAPAVPNNPEKFSYFDVNLETEKSPEVQAVETKEALTPSVVRKSVRKEIEQETRDQDRGFRIIYLAYWMKVVIIMSIMMTRLLVAVMITYAGCKFIMLQRSYEKVVLKALCMQWVVQIDEQLVTSFTTRATKDLLGKVKLYHKKFVSYDEWEHGYGGWVLFGLGGLGVAFVTYVLFGDLMAFRSECLRVTGVGYKENPWKEFLDEFQGLLPGA